MCSIFLLISPMVCFIWLKLFLYFIEDLKFGKNILFISLGKTLKVGLNPKTPQKIAGIRLEPAVSVTIAILAIP